MDDKSLHDQFERAVSARPPTPHLVVNARRAGTRLRRRRRIEAAAVSAVTVALVAVAVSAAAGALNTAGHRPAAADGAVSGPATAYVSTSASLVAPIRLSTDTALRPIRSRGLVMAIAAAPDRKAVFVFSTTSRASYVTRISAGADTAGRPVRLRSGFQVYYLSGFQIAPDGRTGYAVEVNTGLRAELVAINLVTGAVRNLVRTGSQAPFVLTPDGRTVYLTGYGGNQVKRVITRTDRVSTVRLTIPVNAQAEDIAVSPDGRTVYVASISAAGRHYLTWITPINTGTGTAAKSIRISPGFSPRVAIAPDGTTGYVNGERSVVSVNLTTGRSYRPIRLVPAFANYAWPLVVSPTGRIGYAQVGNRSSWVQPVNLVSDTALKPLSLPPGHGTAGVAAFAPTGNTVYIGLYAKPKQPLGEIVPVQTATQQVGKPIMIHGTPLQMVIVR